MREFLVLLKAANRAFILQPKAESVHDVIERPGWHVQYSTLPRGQDSRVPLPRSHLFFEFRARVHPGALPQLARFATAELKAQARDHPEYHFDFRTAQSVQPAVFSDTRVRHAHFVPFSILLGVPFESSKARLPAMGSDADAYLEFFQRNANAHAQLEYLSELARVWRGSKRR